MSSLLVVTEAEQQALNGVFKIADLDRDGRIGRQDAQIFFARFAAEPRVLALLWEFCDVEQSGQLDKPGLCIALRSVWLLKRSNNDMSVLTKRSVRTPNDWPSLFTLEGLPREPAYVHDWPLVRRYFEAYRDRDAGVSGTRAAVALRTSGLSDADLSRIWALADRDRDRSLCFEEFALALWLVSERVANPFADLPTSLSDKLLRAVLAADDDTNGTPGSASVNATRYAWLGAVPTLSTSQRQTLSMSVFVTLMR
jgi:hypothetical protein